MKKDIKLIRSILEVLAASEAIFIDLEYDNFQGYYLTDVNFQMLMMLDAGLVAVKDPSVKPNCYPLQVRITWQGDEWLEKNPG